MQSLSTITTNLAIREVTAESLNADWPFIKRGLSVIVHRLKPDWDIEHIFLALSSRTTSAFIVSRFGVRLGFCVYYKQTRPFSQKPDLFVWAAWILPAKEGGMVADVLPAGWNYLCNVAKTQYFTDSIMWITSIRRGRAFQRKYGWLPKWATFNVQV